MKMFTLKLSAKKIFGILLALTGLIVIIVTFVANRTEEAQSVSSVISAKTDSDRRAFLSKYGFELADDFEKKEITIPSVWNDVYKNYNEIQKNQGFDLGKYKGQKATLYTYTITNCKKGEYIVADLLVLNGELIGGDICNPSASDGYLVGFDTKV